MGYIMGHMIDYIPVDTREDILPAAHDFAHVNTNRQENWDGSYHGNMTILDDVEPLNNYDAAVEYLSKRSQSARHSYADFAVRYYSSDGDKIQNDTVLPLVRKLSALEESTAPCQRKAKYVSCHNCGSKLSTEHLGSHQTECPLCRASLLSETDRKRITALKERIRRAMEKKRLAALKRKSKGKVKWLVKVEVHC